MANKTKAEIHLYLDKRLAAALANMKKLTGANVQWLINKAVAEFVAKENSQ